LARASDLAGVIDVFVAALWAVHFGEVIAREGNSNAVLASLGALVDDFNQLPTAPGR
jgi:hypothetical protein